jgi:hypothetical protein
MSANTSDAAKSNQAFKTEQKQGKDNTQLTHPSNVVNCERMKKFHTHN